MLPMAWNEHPAMPLADDQELQAAKEMFVAGYAPPEQKDGTRLPSPRQLSAERLPVVQTAVSNGAHQVILGGARFIGPGWSGSPMILPGSGRLGGVFCRKNDVRFDGSPVRQSIHDSASGTKVRHTSPTRIGAVPVWFPPVAEQKRVVSQLDALAAETQRLTRLYEQKQAALAALKKSLLHQAFTGELRPPRFDPNGSAPHLPTGFGVAYVAPSELAMIGNIAIEFVLHGKVEG